ncbi:MAG: CopG family transcriptional regulator [Vulcanimicrobiota bacterium]
MAKRTTVTLEDDIAAQLEERARLTGASFEEVINQALRVGLSRQARSAKQKPFKVLARPLGLRRGLSYDNIGDLLEYGEGSHHR